MTESTKKIMTAMKRKLTAYEKKVETHCGHDVLVERAMDARFEMLDWLEAELERLQVGGGQ